MSGTQANETAANSLLGTEWDWCGYHRSHPMVSWDPAGSPYCWEGYWKGEVDHCASVPPLRMRVMEQLG